MLQRVSVVKISNKQLAKNDLLRPTFEGEEGQYAKGSESTIRVIQNGKSWDIHVDEFRQKLKQLRAKWNVDVRSLGKDREVLEQIIGIMQILYQEPKKYETLMSEIREVFEGIENPVPETVAARFIGCFSKNTPSGLSNRGCDPACTASLRPGDAMFSACEDAVLRLEEGSIVAINNRNSSHAYLSISRGDKLSEKNIEDLERIEVTSVTLVIDDYTSGTKELKGPLPLSKLPRNQTGNDQSSDSNGWKITFIVILILLILLLLGIAYYYGIFRSP